MTAAAARTLQSIARLRRLIRVVIAPLAATARALRPRYITVADYLATKELEPGVLRTVQGTFGKRVKAAWITQAGTSPRTIGATTTTGTGKVLNIKVCVYPESGAREVFTAVWEKHYAN